MSTSSEKMQHLLNAESIPVPRKPIKGCKEDPLSRKLRDFDNLEIQLPLPNQSGVYINTNEHGVHNTAALLSEFPRIKYPFHVGFSGWHNFDIMAQRFSLRALLCDINPENALFLSKALTYLRQYEHRAVFIEKISLYPTSRSINS